MGKNKTGQTNPPAGDMLTQKTNEDFNKKKPNLKDPNEQKGQPDTAAPIIAYDDDATPAEKSTDGTINPKNVPNKSDGSE